MPALTPHLLLDRCPHCGVDTPSLTQMWGGETRDQAGANLRRWVAYLCGRCGGLVTAAANNFGEPVKEIYPSNATIPTDLPAKANAYLEQANASIHAPAGALMLTASAVDAMLKAKSYTEGSLYTRIDKAASDHLITDDMAKWAHEVRLDANDQRHADENSDLPSSADAKRAIEFAFALATILFSLPARVKRGLSVVAAAGS